MSISSVSDAEMVGRKFTAIARSLLSRVNIAANTIVFIALLDRLLEYVGIPLAAVHSAPRLWCYSDGHDTLLSLRLGSARMLTSW